MKKVQLLVYLFVLTLASAPVFSQSMPQVVNAVSGTEVKDTPPPKLGMDQRVSLEFRSTDAAEVIKYVAQKAGLNISISNNVTGRVSLFVTDVPIRDVFEIVLRTNNLAYDKQGTVYNIMTEAEYKELYGRKFSDTREIKTFRLKYAIPEQAFNLLDTLKSSIGRLLIDENTGTVLVMDTPEKIREMEEALEVMEQGSEMTIFDLSYANAIDIEEKLKDEFETNRIGTINADERTNQLVVRAIPGRLQEVEQMIKRLDRKTREVLIDAKIVKVTISDDLDSGINWDNFFTNIDFNGIDKVGDFRPTTDATTPGSEIPAATRVQLGPKLPFLKKTLGPEGIGDLVFTTVQTTGYEVIRYLHSLGETKIVSKPRLLVVENQEAKIHVGTREAYVTSTTTTGTSTSTTAEEVQFIDVGIKFTVTPKITKEGFVEMTIVPEVSSVVGTLPTPSGNSIPIVDTTTAETRVLVKDGTTVIIGGLRKKEKKSDNDEVPGLSRLPFIGNLFFKQVDRDDELQELIIFITPHIVEGDQLITGDEEKYGGGMKSYRDYSPTPQGLKEDMIKGDE